MVENIPTTDQTASGVTQTVGSVVSATEAPVEAVMVAAEPWLSFPIINQLWKLLMNFIFSQVGGFLGTLAGYAVIDVQQYLALQNAASALVALKAAQASGDPVALQTANQNIDSAVAPVLHYIGSIHP